MASVRFQLPRYHYQFQSLDGRRLASRNPAKFNPRHRELYPQGLDIGMFLIDLLTKDLTRNPTISRTGSLLGLIVLGDLKHRQHDAGRCQLSRV